MCPGPFTNLISLQAALCALRVIKKVPDIADHFVGKAKNLLTDRNHGVLLTAITLVTEMCSIDEANLNEFRSVRCPPSSLKRAPSNSLLIGCSTARPQSQIISDDRL
jgi:hypothetical protein